MNSAYIRLVTSTLRPEALVIGGNFNSDLSFSLQVIVLMNKTLSPAGLAYAKADKVDEAAIADLLLDVFPSQQYSH